MMAVTSVKDLGTIVCNAGDILLVVNAAGWFCKQCNVQCRFGSGEGIEDHLLSVHDISAKKVAEDTVVPVKQVRSRRGASQQRGKRGSRTSSGTRNHRNMENGDLVHVTRVDSNSPAASSTQLSGECSGVKGFETDSALGDLGPRKRKRTAKAIEADLIEENKVKTRRKSKAGSKRSWSESDTDDSERSTDPDLHTSSSAQNSGRLKVTKFEKKSKMREMATEIQKQLSTCDRVKRKYRQNAESKSASLRIASELKTKYVTNVSADVEWQIHKASDENSGKFEGSGIGHSFGFTSEGSVQTLVGAVPSHVQNFEMGHIQQKEPQNDSLGQSAVPECTSTGSVQVKEEDGRAVHQTVYVTLTPSGLETDGASLLNRTESLTSQTTCTLKPSSSPVSQDDTHTLVLVAGALQDLQDNLLAEPVTPTASLHVNTQQGEVVSVNESHQFQNHTPIKQIEQHVARVAEDLEHTDGGVSENTKLNMNLPSLFSEDAQKAKGILRSQKKDYKDLLIAPSDMSLATNSHYQTSVASSRSAVESACAGAILAERANQMKEKMCELMMEMTVANEADSEQFVMPQKVQHICQFCEHSFNSAEQLNEHVTRYASQKPMQCKICSLKLHSMDLLNVHIFYTHETESVASCLTCGKAVGKKRALLKHIVNQHATARGHTAQSLLTDSRSLHFCDLCQRKILDYPYNIERHNRIHSKKKQHECHTCGKKFHFKKSLRAHIVTHNKASTADEKSTKGDDENTAGDIIRKSSPTGSKYYCTLCGKDMPNNNQTVRKHLLLHAKREVLKSNRQKFFCPECGKDILNRDKYVTAHLKTHGITTFKCKHCEESFDTFADCRRHEKNLHKNPTPETKSCICEVCGKIMASKYSLANHIKTHENTEPPGLYSCDQCSRSFQFSRQLEKHRLKHAPGSSETVPCQHCGKPYMDRKSLKRHIQVEHLGVKDYPHKCDQCPAQFFDSYQLKDHKAFRHDNIRKYKCTECSEAFVCRPTLKRHIFRIHGTYSPHVCNVCGEKFLEKVQLLNHQAVHTGVQPYQCTTCHKNFTRPSSLQIHMNLHAGIRPHPCEKCGKAYGKRSHLLRHQSKCKN